MSLREVLVNGVGRRASAPDAATAADQGSSSPTQPAGRLRERMASWLSQIQRDPTAEERAAEERRTLLLAELNRTVAECPDDVPIRSVIDRLNRHWDD